VNSNVPSYPWINETQRCLDKRKKTGERDKSDYVEMTPLALSTLPCWEGLNSQELKKQVENLLEIAHEEACAKRTGKGFLGTRKIRQQDPLSIPLTVKHSPQPLCHTSSHHLRKDFRAFYRAFVQHFKEASRCFRAGHLSAQFPLYSYPPSLPLRI
jgi:hypothetical protein